MLYSIIYTEKCEIKYDLNHVIFWQKKAIDLNHDLKQWFKSYWFKSANPADNIFPPTHLKPQF